MRISDLDITWTAEAAHQVVIRQFPQYEARSPQLLGRGWDNICILYPDSTVFRLPTRQLGGEIMAIECAVLPKIDHQMSMPVPSFQYFGQPDGDYSWKFVGYQLLEGTTSENLNWTTQERIQAATKLGDFLKQLHTIPISPEIQSLLPTDQLDRSSGAANLRRVTKYHGQTVEEYPDRRHWADRLLAIATDLATSKAGTKLTICHGDLYPRHVLANETKHVIGVIDWGDINIGQPLMDLSIAYTFLDLSERGEFWSAYGQEVSAEDMALARLKALNYALALFLYGRHSNDDRLLLMVDQIADRVTFD